MRVYEIAVKWRLISRGANVIEEGTSGRKDGTAIAKLVKECTPIFKGITCQNNMKW